MIKDGEGLKDYLANANRAVFNRSQLIVDILSPVFFYTKHLDVFFAPS